MHIFEVLVSFFSKVFSLGRFCKSNVGCPPVHKCEAIYWHKRDWRFMEKLYLYFDQFWPVSFLAATTQIPFVLCCSPWTGSKLVVPNCGQNRARQAHPCWSRDSWGHILGPIETYPGPQLPQGTMLPFSIWAQILKKLQWGALVPVSVREFIGMPAWAQGCIFEMTILWSYLELSRKFRFLSTFLEFCFCLVPADEL